MFLKIQNFFTKKPTFSKIVFFIFFFIFFIVLFFLFIKISFAEDPNEWRNKYDYVASSTFGSTSKVFLANSQDISSLGGLFTFLFDGAYIAAIVVIIYKLIFAGWLKVKEAADINSQKKANEIIKVAGWCFAVLIIMAPIATFINPKLLSWNLTGDAGLGEGGGSGSGGGSNSYNGLNNPGNIRTGEKVLVDWEGVCSEAKRTKNNYERFKHKVYGIRVTLVLLQGKTYLKNNNPLDTLNKIIPVYAPSSDTTANNIPEEYAKHVADYAGINPNDNISSHLNKEKFTINDTGFNIMKGIFREEGRWDNKPDTKPTTPADDKLILDGLNCVNDKTKCEIYKTEFNNDC